MEAVTDSYLATCRVAAHVIQNKGNKIVVS